MKVPHHLSRDEHLCLCHNSKNYLIINDTLYHHGVDFILHHCFTHDEVEVVMNDFHGGVCGGHLCGLSIAQKLLKLGYYWLSIFKYCVNVVK